MPISHSTVLACLYLKISLVHIDRSRFFDVFDFATFLLCFASGAKLGFISVPNSLLVRKFVFQMAQFLNSTCGSLRCTACLAGKW